MPARPTGEDNMVGGFLCPAQSVLFGVLGVRGAAVRGGVG